MKIIKRILSDALILEPTIHQDNRGYFYEGFNENNFKQATGIDFNVVQLNISKSTKGVLRGLHYQCEPKSQAKLVAVTSGEVWDVAVDIRKDSPTYGQWHGEVLSAENKRRFFVPKGFAHGLIALSNDVELMYMIDCAYSKEHDSGIIYNDPTLKIDWKLDSHELILSDKDLNLPTLGKHRE